MAGKIRSVIQQLIRAFYGTPGRQARIRRVKPEKPVGAPWGTDDRGRRARRKSDEPLEHPPLQVLTRSHELQRIYAELVRVSQERENRYKDYEDMILDPSVSGAIEMMTDDACQYSRENNATVWVKTEDSKIRRATDELFDIIQLEERLFDWCFGTAMYGDFFLQVIGQEGRGVLLVQDDWHPADIQRLDVNGALLGFRTPKSFVETQQQGVVGESEFWDPWEFVHFKIQASQRRRREVERERMSPMLRFERNKYRLTTRYGVSVVEAVRRIYKQLMMVEQSLVISRMTRALLKYLYKVQCGAEANVKDSVEIINQMRELLTQQTGIKIGESFEQQFAPLTGSEDIFLPVFGERGDVTVETLGGETNVTGIVDVDYLRKKFFGGLKTPAAFLGFEGDLPGSLGDSALLRISIRYARTVKRVQRSIIQGLTRLTQIHLAYKGLSVDPKKFSVEMDVISTAEEEERKASLSSAVGVASDLARLNTELRVDVPVKEFAKLVYSEVLSLGGRFTDLLDKAKELPPEGVVDGAIAGRPGEELPPEGLEPGEGPLEAPPEAEEVPPPEGPLEAPPGAESTKATARDTLVESAKREAMESVTQKVRQSADVKAETPRWDSGKHQKPSRISRHMRGGKTDLSKVIKGAIELETRERVGEKERREKLVEKLNTKLGEVDVLVSSLGSGKN